jgi:hypothetical protein
MAKAKLPKRIAGFKVPKGLRRSKLVKGLLGSRLGRQIVADALVVGATAAAAALVREREEVADATMKGARKGARAFGVLGEAIESGVDAAVGSVTEAVRKALPEDKRAKRRRGKAAEEAGTRH